MNSKIKIDGFVLSIIVTIIIAYFIPRWGKDDSVIPLSFITSAGVMLIFFFYGLKLSGSKIKQGLSNWQLHVLVQLSSFLLFPLLVLPLYPFVQTEHEHMLWLALLFMAALPSTVSSSVVMVALAKGNLPAAIFNASISGIIGLMVTPLWMGLFVPQSEFTFNYTQIYGQLFMSIVLPVILGLMLQKYWGKYAVHYGKQLAYFDKIIILLIIFKSFSESFANGVFSAVTVVDLLIIVATVLLLFFVVFYTIGFIANKLHFTIEDKITAQFCGTKKSLVHGTVFYKILFTNAPSSAIVLLPLMLFHALQIIIVSLYANAWGKRNATRLN